MANLHKHWIIIPIAMIAAAVLTVVMSFAYYNAVSAAENRLNTSEAKVYMAENFSPSDRWVPGEEKVKEVYFGNSGTMDAVVRVKFNKKLTLSDGTEVTDEAVLNGFSLNFAEGFADKWIKGSDGWYYSCSVLAAGCKSDVTLKSVTVSNGISNDVHGAETDYSSSVFTVDVESQMLQASAAEDAAQINGWGMIPKVSGESVSWNAE